MSAVQDLNDACFSIASEFLAEISDEFKEEVGRRPTLSELSEILFWGIKSVNAEILDDVDVAKIERIEIRTRKRPPTNRMLPGDLVAVPLDDGQYLFAVFIADNRIGAAYGFFSGKHNLRPRSDFCNLSPVTPVVYSGKNAVHAGKWPIVGNFPELLGLFPSNPEIFYMKKDHPSDDSVGPFGSAETPDGKMRVLEKAEAEALGLDSGWYRQTVIDDLVGKYILERCLRQD
jgi:hypothetical protein